MVFQLQVQRYRLEFVTQTSSQFPRYAGSMWRGAFGHALKRAVCITRLPSCSECLLKEHCAYSQIFETPAGREPLLSKINHAPHPYIIEPLQTSGAGFEVGEVLRIGLTVVGRANQQLPYLIHAFQQLGELGLGKAQVRLQLQAVYQEVALGVDEWSVIYQPTQQLQALASTLHCVPSVPERVQLRWLTPFRAKHQEHLVVPSGFIPEIFMVGLVRRLSLLAAYWDEPLSEVDTVVEQVQAAVSSVVLEERALYWQEWARFSNRQQRLVQMDGIMGSVVWSGVGLARCWEWLWWGQWLHAGKGTVMGLGGYELVRV